MRLVLATAIILLGAAWMDSVQRVVDANPAFAEHLRAYVVGPFDPEPLVRQRPIPERDAYEAWPPAVGFASQPEED
jgi:hypothetical protein